MTRITNHPQLPDPHTSLRLHLNENTAGCAPSVLEALRSIDALDVSVYPDYTPVMDAASRWLGLLPEHVQLTNGLDEGLHVVAQAVRLRRHGGFEAIVVEPAFEMYEACAEAAGGRVVRVMPGDNFAFPIDDVIAAIGERTGLIYLTDPNNPTGLPIPPADLSVIVDAAARAEAIVFIDEAYADFSGHSFVNALDRHRHVIVGRTFAKAHGLAALRAGAMAAHPDTLAPLRRILPPFNLNIAAARALVAAIEDRPYLNWYRAQAALSREAVYAFCDSRALTYWRSEGNFVLLRLGSRAAQIVAALAAQRVFISNRSHQPGCDGCVRMTAGVLAHTEACLSQLGTAL
jgi:histidinol-phosphate aminotransferase